MRTLMILTLALGVAPLAVAQPHGKQMSEAEKAQMMAAMKANPISFTLGRSYERTKKFIIDSAEQMPANEYGYKPTPDVRSFGQLMGHIADASFMFCSVAKQDKMEKKDSAEKLTDKGAIQKALKDAFSYCDKVYAESTDATLGTTMVEMFHMHVPKFAPLDINIDHLNEHYGNLVTYMRLKKMTPPSSQGGM